jgi:dihydrofolate reductase
VIKCSVFIATSLDGFIARKDGSIDWLEAANQTIPVGTDLGYERFFTSIDALVMGRKTFEQVLTFPEWAYADKPLIVLSRTLAALPTGVPANVSLSHETPIDLVSRLEREGFHHLYVDGGMTIQSFLQAGLIDEMTITIIPVLLGEGLLLFGQIARDVHFSLVSISAYEFGFVQSTYRINEQLRL